MLQEARLPNSGSRSSGDSRETDARRVCRCRGPRPSSNEMVPFVTPAGARDPADARSPVTLGNAPRRCPFGSRSTSLVDGSFERHATNVRPGHGQEPTYQKINHVRRSIGQAAEFGDERFEAARQVMQAAGRHGKGAQQRRSGTVPLLSQDSPRPLVDDPGRPATRRSSRTGAEGCPGRRHLGGREGDKW